MKKNEDYIMDIESYEEALIGGLNPIEEVKAEIEEMKKAPVGYLKPNYWEKLDETTFKFFVM